MFSYVEETEEGTVLYQVRTYRWCMCWAFFNASEVFELTGRERQKFCVHGIIGARQTGASNEHEHQTQFS